MMNFIFFGTPDRARIVLERLEQQGCQPIAIVTAPDKPVGRKQIITASPVSDFGTSRNIPVYKPQNKIELMELAPKLIEYKPDFLLVVAYGYIIPQAVLDIPTYEPINIHYSLLPRWRGASPVVQQILHSDKTVGWSVMRLVKKLDAGAVFYQKSYPMPKPLPTTGQLATQMSGEAGDLLPDILAQIKSGNLTAVEQNEKLVSVCHKLDKADGEINFNDSPAENYRKIKAFQPWPKTFFYVTKNDRQIRIIINDADFSESQLNITSVTPAGKSAMYWEQFLKWLGYDPIIS